MGLSLWLNTVLFSLSSSNRRSLSRSDLPWSVGSDRWLWSSGGGLKGGFVVGVGLFWCSCWYGWSSVLVWLWVCWLLIVGFVQFCGYFVNDWTDLIFGFKSFSFWDNLVCVYIWIDFVLYNILLWFFCVWFLGLYDFFGFVLVCSWWVCMIFWVCLIFWI